HNGEINTISGNRMWAQARRYKFQCEDLPNIDEIAPLVSMSGSDSQSLDNMLEVMLAGGEDLFAAMRALVPPAWQNVENIDADVRAFYEYNSLQMEPWDGPAGIVLTDGRYAVCATDRNGLRPTRYVIGRDRTITLASEIGVNDVAPEDVVEKGRLRPGQMLAIDTESGTLMRPFEIDRMLAARQPYKQWLKRNILRLESSLQDDPNTLDKLHPESVAVFQKLFQLSNEERGEILRVLGESGQETIGSMGDDTPFAVLSAKVRSPYDYFRQQFAQVTNPPIDPLREQIVMSLECSLGAEHGMFEETPERAARLLVDSPILSEGKFRKLLSLGNEGYPHAVIDLNYKPEIGLQKAVEAVCDRAVAAVREGTIVLVLSDRGVARESLPIHALLATGAVQHRLIAEGLRCDCNIIVETATARDPHHFACLVGYGASCVYPYLAYASLYEMTRTGEIKNKAPEDLAASYRKGINKGLYKIMSKMGIATISSYRGAQLFEIVGLHNEIVKLCFEGTVSRIQGSGFAELQAEQTQLSLLAWTPRKPVEQGGLYKFVQNAEYHAYHPDIINTLHRAVRSGEYADYEVFADLVNHRPVATIRDLLKLSGKVQAISIDEVEPIEAILKRFDSAGMSLGALSPEAHEALAIAMNSLGGRSNSGEGGEDPARYGTEKTSKIKQVASGRFGVTPAYLVSAEVLQIKVAQGAKPGEGGQLPGHKVDWIVAKTRHSTPGVGLISPPPHHDIYSIEDLAQLIYDLKNVNETADISVKLVSEVGVGTVAAGVAKARADHITVSGYDGGTGASPLTSLKHAGGPWEIGLAETHQTLVLNRLRSRVVLQVDGGLKTGRDVLIGALLGADEFGFSTAPLIAAGCIMMRKCHLNTCPVGVATQDPVLRKRFKGTPEHVINYFFFIAEELRGLLAGMGARTLNELVGRSDLLDQRKLVDHWKSDGIDFSKLFYKPEAIGDDTIYHSEFQDHHLEAVLDRKLIELAQPALENGTAVHIELPIRSRDRSAGAMLSGALAKKYGHEGLLEDTIAIKLTGTAGQSFGAFLAKGISIDMVGDANDYVGKGLSGGRIVVRPSEKAGFDPDKSIIVGNTVLYGAIEGEAYFRGIAGERFAVRNSGAIAVVEGTGDHGCEYMTGGVVVVIGQTGRNFAAGMSGGVAYVLDEDQTFRSRCNLAMVDLEPVTEEENLMQSLHHHGGDLEWHGRVDISGDMTKHDDERLQQLIANHLHYTGSTRAKYILDNWAAMRPKFVKVMPVEYRRAIRDMEKKRGVMAAAE
ncbi:MAG: glutamate synthase large subunit, partial [Devosia sp.]|uniref:glutamate synthase large subunit n=1 Tax=Devosia sp. TaxID=1871048 RepID=UPI00261F1F0A